MEREVRSLPNTYWTLRRAWRCAASTSSSGFGGLWVWRSLLRWEGWRKWEGVWRSLLRWEGWRKGRGWVIWADAGAGDGGRTMDCEIWESCGRCVLRGEGERQTSTMGGTVGVAGSGRLGVDFRVVVDHL